MDGLQTRILSFYFGRQYSSSLLVLMSIEKCFAVYFPLKSKTVCTVRIAKRTTGIVGLFWLLMICSGLFYWNHKSVSGLVFTVVLPVTAIIILFIW